MIFQKIFNGAVIKNTDYLKLISLLSLCLFTGLLTAQTEERSTNKVEYKWSIGVVPSTMLAEFSGYQVYTSCRFWRTIEATINIIYYNAAILGKEAKGEGIQLELKKYGKKINDFTVLYAGAMFRYRRLSEHRESVFWRNGQTYLQEMHYQRNRKERTYAFKSGMVLGLSPRIEMVSSLGFGVKHAQYNSSVPADATSAVEGETNKGLDVIGFVLMELGFQFRFGGKRRS